MLEIEWILIFALLGTIVGFIAGLLGLGGGGMLVPVLSSLFLLRGIPTEYVVHMALGSSMACVVSTSLSSTVAHYKKAGVHWPTVKKMAMFVSIGTCLATYIAAHVNATYLAILFSVYMSYTGFRILIPKTEKRKTESLSCISLLLPSTGIGAISALVSIGGGSLIVPFLVGRGFYLKQAIGTSAAIGLIISFTATLGYLLSGLNSQINFQHTLGFIYWPAVLVISITSFISAPLGASVAYRVPVLILKRLFAALLFVLSLKMLVVVMVN